MVIIISNEEILKYAIENGIIDFDTIQDKVEMNKRKELLEKHPYAITKSSDGYFRTYLPKQDGGRKQIKRKYEEDILDIICEFWGKKDIITFNSRFECWKKRQEICGRSSNTIAKYESDNKRCLSGDIIENMDIAKINEEELCLFIKRLTERKQIPYRALKSLFGMLDGVFKMAVRDKVVEYNPCNYVDIQFFKQYCTERDGRTSEERTLSIEEKKMLMEKLNRNTNPVKYAILLAMYTGMRVGELSALKWECIDYKNGYILVNKSEKKDRRTGQYFISTTKNDKVRKIPLTEDMIEILRQAKKYSADNDCISEFVFCDKGGNLHTARISSAMRNYTMTNEFSCTKSIHAIRRTLNSNMKCMGVPTTIASSILGHTEKVNELNYTYDVSNMDEKRSIIELAGKIV